MLCPMRIILSSILSFSLCISLLPSQAFALSDGITFSNPVRVSENSSPKEILMQSDNYKDGKLTIDGREYEFNDNDFPVLTQEEKGLFCRWFGWWCPTLEVGDISVTQEQAKEKVLKSVIPKIHLEMTEDTGRVQPMLAFAWPEAIPAGTVIERYFSENMPLNVTEDSWFFFLDLEPQAYFGHRAEYVLVDAKTGEVTRKRVFSPPVIDGEVRYLGLKLRFESEDRFYPASLDDLPEASDWPMEFASPFVGAPENLAPQGMQDELSWLESSKILAAKNISFNGMRIPSALAQANPADPCAGQPRKTVAVTLVGEGPNTLHGSDGFVDGADMAAAEGNMVNMLGRLGVANGDIHRFNPENTPKIEDVFKEIKRLTKNLGPCDKFFFYIFAHGTYTDANDDHIPDTPSSSMVYGHGDNSERISKTRWGKNSLIKLLEGINAQDINLVIESCFSGSIRDFIDSQIGNAAAGSSWHIFLAANSIKPSYGPANGDGAYYTDAFTACVSRRLAAQGIANPTIEDMERIMRECQDELGTNRTTFLSPPVVEDVQHITYTVSPNVSVQEGDDGLTYATFTITRNPVEDRVVTLEYSTYDPDEDNPDLTHYANPRSDYFCERENRVQFDVGQATVTVRIAIYGDTIVESDETFGVWFPAIGIARRVTIVDDDAPPVVSSSSSSTGIQPPSSSSSSSSQSSSSSEGGEEVDGYITINLEGKYGLNDVYDYDYEYGDGEVVDITITFEPEEKSLAETLCELCDEIVADIIAQEDICDLLADDLADARDEMAALDAQIATAQSDLTDAQNALNEFDNPRSSASGNGRTVDSTDLKVDREWARQQWGEYGNGNMTAQELEQSWKDGPTEADRTRIRNQLRTQLQTDITNAQNRLNALNAQKATLQAEITALEADVDACEDEVDRLYDELDACELLCAEAEEDEIGSIGDDVSSSSSSESSSSESSSSESSSSESSSSSTKSSSSQSSESSSSVSSVIVESSSSSSAITTGGGVSSFSSSSESSSSSSSVVSSSSSSSSSEEIEYSCDDGTMELALCEQSCEDSDIGDCEKAYTRDDGEKCYSCVEKETGPSCPAGTVADAEDCDRQCSGECQADSNGCYSCVVLQCPDGTYDECPSSCANGCDVAAQEGSTTCYVCKQSCEEVCAQYDKVGTNWTSYMQSYLNEFSCVSGASASIATATIGDCVCSNQPTVSIDQTPPVCTGTPCGDVTCGSSSSCQDGDTTITVNCNWGGWENIGENQFRIKLGQ